MGLAGFIVTLILVFALFVGLHVYVPWRLIRLLELRRKKLVYIAFAVAGISMGIATGPGATSDNFLLQSYGRLAGLWIGVFLYGVMLLGVFEAINAIKRLPPKPSLLVIAALTAAVNIYGFVNARQLSVVKAEIPVKGLNKPVSIVHLPDVHLGNWRGRGHLDRITDHVLEIKPDLVVFNGDFVDGRCALTEEDFAPLARITKAGIPMYFTAGNHDIYVSRKRTEALLRKLGVRVLKNDVVVTHGIQLLGLDYLRADNETYDPHGTSKVTLKSTMPRIAGKLRKDLPVVAFHHSPIGVKYLQKAGVNVLLAGHTHGGQMFPWTLAAGLQFPYKVGHYTYKGMRIYVSQGAGTFGPPLRIGTDNEINHVVLMPAKNYNGAK